MFYHLTALLWATLPNQLSPSLNKNFLRAMVVEREKSLLLSQKKTFLGPICLLKQSSTVDVDPIFSQSNRKKFPPRWHSLKPFVFIAPRKAICAGSSILLVTAADVLFRKLYSESRIEYKCPSPQDQEKTFSLEELYVQNEKAPSFHSKGQETPTPPTSLPAPRTKRQREKEMRQRRAKNKKERHKSNRKLRRQKEDLSLLQL